MLNSGLSLRDDVLRVYSNLGCSSSEESSGHREHAVLFLLLLLCVYTLSIIDPRVKTKDKTKSEVPVSEIKELQKVIMLNCCSRSDSLWYRKNDSCGSPVTVTAVSQSSIWSRKRRPSGLTGPSIPIATTTKTWVSVMVEYLNIFHMATASAAKLRCKKVDDRYRDACEFIIVASHIRHRPFCYGTRVRLSGRFPSSLSNPVGSLVTGISDCLQTHQMWWRVALSLSVCVCSSYMTGHVYLWR